MGKGCVAFGVGHFGFILPGAFLVGCDGGREVLDKAEVGYAGMGAGGAAELQIGGWIGQRGIGSVRVFRELKPSYQLTL